MQLHAYTARGIANKPLPGRSAVIRFADSEDMLAPIYDKENACFVLDVLCADMTESSAGLRAPAGHDAMRIAAFCRKAHASGEVEHLVAQCQVGIGRSVAVVGALADLRGEPWKKNGTHNRKLYKMLRAELGLPELREPLVSICVRAKYNSEYLHAFLLSLRRQRHENWEAIIFSDGGDLHSALSAPIGRIEKLEKLHPRQGCSTENRIRYFPTPKRLGKWGHPYRQFAFSQCHGEWIGTNNDDNYLTPGYIEQMVQEATDNDASLVMCHAIHRYSGYCVCQVGDDLACWLAKREIVQQCRWDDFSFAGDKTYLEQLMRAVNGHCAVVSKPLVVKN